MDVYVVRLLCIPHGTRTSISSHLDDILTEDAILKWYQDAHITKGKREFISQMKYMIDWFNTAEEESDEADATAEQLSWPISFYISYLQQTLNWNWNVLLAPKHAHTHAHTQTLVAC